MEQRPGQQAAPTIRRARCKQGGLAAYCDHEFHNNIPKLYQFADKSTLVPQGLCKLGPYLGNQYHST
eukprot:356147-Heterocapsa_arctica.AAC.1